MQSIAKAELYPPGVDASLSFTGWRIRPWDAATEQWGLKIKSQFTQCQICRYRARQFYSCLCCCSPCMTVCEVAQGTFFNIQKAQSLFFTRWCSYSEAIGWSVSKFSFKMPKPHEIQNTKGWCSTSWYSTNWYRFFFLLSLCFSFLAPSEAKNKVTAPKGNNKSNKNLVCCIPSGFLPDQLSSILLHPVETP